MVRNLFAKALAALALALNVLASAPAPAVAQTIYRAPVTSCTPLRPHPTDSTTLMQMVFNAFGSVGGTACLGGGRFYASSEVTVPTLVRVEGAGKYATCITKSASWVGGTALINESGSSTSVRNQRGGLADLCLDGNAKTGLLLRTDFADHLNFDRVYFVNNNDVAWSASELWDSYCVGCEFEYVGTQTWRTGAAVRLTGSATDKTNEIYFLQSRWENIPGHALYIDSNGTGNAPYGIYLSQFKIESNNAHTGVAFVESTNDVSDVHLRDGYIGLNGTAASNSPIDAIDVLGANGWVIDGIRANIGTQNGGLGGRSVVRLFTSGKGHFVGNIYQTGSNPSVGVVEFAGGSPTMQISNVTGGTTATLYSGGVPSTVSLNDYALLKNSQLGVGSRYLNLAGGGVGNGNYASTPDSARLEPGSAPFTLDVKVQLTSWATGGNQIFAGKFDSGYALYVDATGKLCEAHYVATVFKGSCSAAAISATASTPMWLRMVVDSVNGSSLLATSVTGDTWNVVGQSSNMTKGAVDDSATAYTAGGPASTATGVAGRILAQRLAIKGKPDVVTDFSTMAATAALGTVVDQSGLTWTMNGSSAIQ